MAPEEKPIWIAVMGPTGTGKTTFINLASGSNLAVSHSLESGTVEVETATFSFDGRSVTLIDTPGFDDTTRSEADILKSVADFLSSSYSLGARLSGVIFMHRITDNKMGAPSKRNLTTCRSLIGNASLRNVVLVTNMWRNVDHKDGVAREYELATSANFFKPVLDHGARMFRHDGTQESAHTILNHLIALEPSTLLVQDEMVNQKKELAHTTVGTDLVNTLKEQAERHTQALDDLCLGIDAARVAKDEETRVLLEEEARKARDKIERIRGDLERMVASFAVENERLENENKWYREKQKLEQERKRDKEQGGIEGVRVMDDDEKTELLQQEARTNGGLAERTEGDLEWMIMNLAAENAKLKNMNQRNTGREKKEEPEAGKKECERTERGRQRPIQRELEKFERDQERELLQEREKLERSLRTMQERQRQERELRAKQERDTERELVQMRERLECELRVRQESEVQERNLRAKQERDREREFQQGQERRKQLLRECGRLERELRGELEHDIDQELRLGSEKGKGGCFLQ